jgi:methyl-accepting chemotaxis protein
MKKMTLGWRLGASFGALILLTGVVGGIAIWRISMAAMRAVNVSTKRGPEVQISQIVGLAAWETRYNIRSYALSGDEEYLRTGRRLLAMLKDHLKTAGELAVKFPDLTALKNGKTEAVAKINDYEALVDKMEVEYKNGVQLDASLDAAGKRFMDTAQALRHAEQRLLNADLTEWDGLGKMQEPNGKEALSTGKEPTAKVDLSTMQDRLTRMCAIDDMIDASNAIQINNFKAGRDGNMDAMNSVLKEFVTLDKIIAGLAPLVQQENIAQLGIIQKAAEDYKSAMEKDLRSQLAIREYTKNVSSLGQSVTNKAAEVANAGVQAIGRDATYVAEGLGLTDAIVQMGLVAALLAGVMIAWLCTRAITVPIREGVNALAATASEISTTISQLASNASETAAAVAETTTTVDEVRQTAQVAADKAKAVADSAQGAVVAAEKGRKATDQTVLGLNVIRDQMSCISESITRLNEQSQTVGDIVGTVADLAEQSNLLAVNASIEAAKAGEHGRGFGVVAQEIRNLAEQSKDSTKQVRAILSEVQKATGVAVMAAAQGSSGVADGSKQADEAGQAIRTLSSTVQEATRAALQIAASSQQQLVGMEQVGRAMENIKTATSQNAEGAQQLASAAHNLRDIGTRLKELVDVSVNETHT